MAADVPEDGGGARLSRLEDSMDFEPWFNAEWDEEHRAGYHEGGHIEYARHIDPNCTSR